MKYAYYNEFDPKAAGWLRELIKGGLIAPGIVDERSIADVRPEELKDFTQCHFFAGIGGWSYALRLAGWPDDRPIWTGSPPCQPFSNAGKQKAQADVRHLWPVFFNLIRECKPSNIFGEQVEAAIRTGWLDDLQDDLEAENYATGKIVLPACSVGGYHIRQRIWFVAERMDKSKIAERGLLRNAQESETHAQVGRSSGTERLADAADNGHPAPNGLREKAEPPKPTGAQNIRESKRGRDNSGLADTNDARSQRRPRVQCADECVARSGGLAFWMADTDSSRREQGQWNNQTAGHGDTVTTESCDDRPKSTNAPEAFWTNPDWLYCRDGKWRPVESGTFPLANGLPERVGLLRGYGNAIVPQVAAEVIKAYMYGQDKN